MKIAFGPLKTKPRRLGLWQNRHVGRQTSGEGVSVDVEGSVQDVAEDVADRLCFLADAVLARPDEDLEAASRRGLGKILEDVAVMLAEAVMQEGKKSNKSNKAGQTCGNKKY